MDIVYVCKARGRGEELRYSLRSLENIPHNNVWIVGDTYPWIKNTRFLNLYQGGSSWDSVHNNLRRVCRESDLSDDFIFFNDDFYIMSKLEAMPMLHAGPLADLKSRYPNSVRHYYARIVRNTFEYLGPGSISYELHVPMVLNKNLLPPVIESSKDKLFRTIYGNKYSVGGEYYKDKKVRAENHPVPALAPEEVMNSPFISSSNKSFKGYIGEFIRHSFPKKSPYEL